MRVARVNITAAITSFRYPHFLVGRQVSYDMPPPSTIYGHIVSAVGDWINPTPLRFAYTFSFASKGSDLEYQHIISRGPPDKLTREQSASFRDWRAQNPLSVGGSVQPTLHDFLFQAELTLYLAPATLASAFRSPVFPVVLGRSQDLACVVSVEEMELQTVTGAYFESMLVPFSWRTKTPFGTTVLMPRFISPPPEREPVFAQYIVLRRGERLYSGDAQIAPDDRRRLLRYEETERWLVDPKSPIDSGVHRGVVPLSFVD
jgi:CRISPR-associated protein Cas5t